MTGTPIPNETKGIQGYMRLIRPADARKYWSKSSLKRLNLKNEYSRLSVFKREF